MDTTDDGVDPDASRSRSDADVIIVGAGPGGCVLSYLLARSGVETVLLERHVDLDREFRGFGFQPDCLRLFDEMSVLERVLALDHAVIDRGEVVVCGERYELFDFEDLPGQHRYAILMEQPPLLRLVIEEASRYENFEFRSHTPVRDLLTEDGRVVGVSAIDHDTGEELLVRGRLTVGADGRFSTVRQVAGIDPGLLESTIELVWFKLPAGTVEDAGQARIGEHGLLMSFGIGGGETQLGWFVEKGTYPDLRRAGIEAFRERLVRVDPGLAAAFPEGLTSFADCSLLHIEPGISERWVDDGLLLLGDAAHVASPIGAQGNALAIQDAVCAHATIVPALGEGDGFEPLAESVLAPYEERRRRAVEGVLRGQRRAERALSSFVRHHDRIPRRLLRPLLKAPFAAAALLPWVRLPFARRRLATLAFGPDPVSVATEHVTERRTDRRDRSATEG